MGVVYRARHLRLNRPVALKMILAGAYAAPEELERFLREAEAVAALQHPNIVQVYEVGEHGRPAVLRDGAASTAARLAAEAGRDAAAGPRGGGAGRRRWPTPSRRPTQRGIVHRDLKPANVLLDRRRHAQGDRLRPGQAAGRRARADADRGGRGHARATWPRSRPRGDKAPSGRRRTSTPWGRSCTSCSPAGRRSSAETPTGDAAAGAGRRAGAARAAEPAACRATWKPSA